MEDKNEMAIENPAETKEKPVENPDIFTWVLSRPITWEGKTYETLTFDYGKLTVEDTLLIEREIHTLGLSVFSREFSGENQIRVAARACDQSLGVDFFKALPMRDGNRILAHTRDFLLGTA